MFHKKFKLNYFIITIFLLIILHGIANYTILKQSRFIPSGDAAGYYYESIAFFRAIKTHRSFNDYINAYISTGYGYCSPIFMMVPSINYFLFQISITSATMSNMYFFTLLLFSTYGMAKYLYNSQAGLLAAFILSMFPGIFGFSRVMMLDFALTSMVAFSMYSFIINTDFQSRKYSILWGISLGLGMLTKGPFIIYICPVFIIILCNLIAKSYRKNFNFLNFSLSIFIGLILMLTWYSYHFVDIIEKAKLAAFTHYGFYWHSYISFLYNYKLLLPYFLLFLISLIVYIKKKDYILPLFLLIPLIILSCLPNKSLRFTMPILIPIAIIMAVTFVGTRLDKKRSFIVGLLVIFSILQYALISFIPNNIHYLEALLGDSRRNIELVYGLYHKVDLGDWKARKIINILSENINLQKDKHLKVLVLPNAQLLIHSIRFISITYGEKLIDVICPAEACTIHGKKIHNFDSFVSKFKFVITKTGDQGHNWRPEFRQELNNAFLKQKSEFSILNEYTLPDKSVLTIHKRR